MRWWEVLFKLSIFCNMLHFLYLEKVNEPEKGVYDDKFYYPMDN